MSNSIVIKIIDIRLSETQSKKEAKYLEDLKKDFLDSGND